MNIRLLMTSLVTVAGMTALMTGAAAAHQCPADFEFVSPQGHEGRASSVAGLSAMFKAGAEKNEAAFLATAADPYIQHSLRRFRLRVLTRDPSGQKSHG